MESFSPYLDTIKSATANYVSTFKQYPVWKQAVAGSAIVTGSCVVYTLGSYYYCKLRYPSLPKVHYSITGDLNNNNGIVAFIHGFPDFGYLWEKQIEFFKSKNYCCINLEIPNFNISRIQNPWGYEMSVVIDALGKTLKDILDQKECSLIVHDWGAYLGEMVYLNYKTEINIKALVLLDVADGDDNPEEQKKYAYQFIQAFGFLLPTYIGSWYLRRFWMKFADQIKMPLFEKEKKEGKTYFSSYCAYLYFYIFKAVFGGYGEGLAVRERLNEFDGLPILFIDGKFAPEEGEGIRFYSSKFKNFLDERDYCKFVEFDQCTHWGFFQDRAKQANDTIYQFLQK